MFGAFGLNKLVILVLVIAVAWYGFRLVGRLSAERKALQRALSEARSGRRRAVEDMVKCGLCGDYVPQSGVGACERANCPSR
jgi:hypothetical protein